MGTETKTDLMSETVGGFTAASAAMSQQQYSLFAKVAFYLCAAGMFMSTFWLRPVTVHYQYGDLFFIASALALIPGVLAGHHRLWLPWWFIFSVFLLLASLAIRQIGGTSYVPRDDFFTVLQVLFSMYIIVFVVTNQQFVTQREIKWLLYAWLASVVFSAVVGFLESRGIRLPVLARFMVDETGGRVRGLNSHSNVLAYYIACAVPVLTVYAFVSKHAITFFAWILTLGLCIYVTDLTGARMSLVGSMLGAVVALLALARLGVSGKQIFRGTLVLLGLCFVVVIYFGQSDQSALQRLLSPDTTSAVKSNWGRDVLQSQAWHNFYENPLSGLGYHDVAHAHNVWLSALECGGLLGFLSLVFFQLGIVVFAFRAWRLGGASRLTYQQKIMASTMAAVFVVWFIYGVKSSLMTQRNLHAMMGLLILTVCYYTGANRVTKREDD